MFVIAAVVVAIIYVNVNKRLKMINQNIKASSPVKAPSISSHSVARKNERKYENIPSSTTIDWDEVHYDVNSDQKLAKTSSAETAIQGNNKGGEYHDNVHQTNTDVDI